MPLLRLNRFQLPRPNLHIHELAHSIQEHGKPNVRHKENQSHWQSQHLQNRINPHTRHVINDIDPNEICEHERGQTAETGHFWWILPKRTEHFHNDTNQYIAVQDVVQPIGKEGVQHFWEDQFTIIGVNSPEIKITKLIATFDLVVKVGPNVVKHVRRHKNLPKRDRNGTRNWKCQSR